VNEDVVLILKHLTLPPLPDSCAVCGWPVGEGYVCLCGDTMSEREKKEADHA